MLGRRLLYLSHFLKKHRAEYYRRLDDIRTTGGWEEWIAFFGLDPRFGHRGMA